MIKYFQKLKAKKGFTLVELIVVIAIIGVLAAILIPTMLGYVTSSRVTSADSTASTLRETVNAFIVQRDAEGDNVKRVATVNSITISVTNGTATVTVPAALTDDHATWDTKLKGVIEADYDFNNAAARVDVVDGKVSSCVFYNGGALPGDEPAATAFASGSFGWNGKTAGITSNGNIIGTSPKLKLS